MDEAQHIRRFIQGDAPALCELVEAYRAQLYSFIVHMIAGKDDADEIFQEVWIKAIHALPRYQHRQKFASWLFKIAHRLIIDRSRRKKNNVSLDELSDHFRDPGTATHNTPCSNMVDAEIGTSIRKAVDALPQEQREVFLLRMDADLSFKEIARMQHTSINTALARMSYALGKLRNQLDHIYKEIK